MNRSTCEDCAELGCELEELAALNASLDAAAVEADAEIRALVLTLRRAHAAHEAIKQWTGRNGDPDALAHELDAAMQVTGAVLLDYTSVADADSTTASVNEAGQSIPSADTSPSADRLAGSPPSDSEKPS